MPIIQIRKDIKEPKSKSKAGTKKPKKAAVPSKKLDEKVTKNPTGDK